MDAAEIIVRLDLEAVSLERQRREMESAHTHQGKHRMLYRILGRQLDRARTRRLELSDALVDQVGLRMAAQQVEAWRRELQSPPTPDPRFATVPAQRV